MNRLVVALWLLLFGSAFAEPGVAVLTFSKKAEVNKKAVAAKHFLMQLRQQNGLDETQFSIITVDMADPVVQANWRKQFEVTPADLPALAYVTRKGNKIADLGTMIRKFSDPMKAAGSAFKYAQTQNLPIKVVEILTGLDVQSVPEGATIYLNGEEVGVTPVSGLAVAPGKVARLELKHPDTDEWSSNYQLKPGEVQNVQVTLRQLDGTARFESSVPATIFLDGSPTPNGTTPLDIKGLRSGNHTATVKAEGHFDSTFAFRVAGNKMTTIACTPVPARLKVAYDIKSTGFSTEDMGVSLDADQLAAELSKVVNEQGRCIAVAGGSDWDVAIKVNLKVSRFSMEGAFILIDRTQATLSSENGAKGVPLISFNYSAAATNNAKIMIREIVPKLVAGLSVEKLSSASDANVPPTMTVQDLPKE